jgi:hypothetical protein
LTVENDRNKEAGTVGKTERSEQNCLALGIVHTLVAHDDELTKKTLAEFAYHLAESAGISEKHEELKEDPLGGIWEYI